MINKYLILKDRLETTGTGEMKAYGNSMLPVLHSGSTLTYIKQDEYEVGDITFSYCRGRFIDAHWIIKKDKKRGYLIANNHGWENGWTHKVFGKVIQEVYKGNIKQFK